MLPESYLSPLHLPFNRTCLDNRLQLQSPDADPGGDGCWLVLQGANLVTRADAPQLPTGDITPLGRAAAPPVYIGLWDGLPCRILVLDNTLALPDGWAAQNLVADAPRLPIELLSLGGLARQILHWQRSSRYCSRCGKENLPLAADWGAECSGCGYHHFPHVHPCAIVIVRRPGEILLTRKPQWAEGRYSLVAGFMEMGESLEETAAREVLEETGIVIDNIRYVGSQGWPFPSQLMAGFTADYVSGEIVIERSELEDVRWFPVDELPKLPPKRSIARYLIDNYRHLP